MSRISIDVTAEQHKKLKALAALQGRSIKEFVLASTLGAYGEDPALAELENLLDRRVHRATTDGVSTRTVAEVFEQAREQAKRAPDA